MGRVEEAFAALPREGFLPPDQVRFAGLDAALPIGYGVTNSQPSTVRAMLALLDPRPGDRVLDVGAGSGWTTALLAWLVGPAGRVVAVERIPAVLRFGRENVTGALLSDGPLAPVEMHPARQGVLGWPDGAPYDRILVSAGAAAMPDQLVDQLAPNGVIVAPVAGVMQRLTRHPDGSPPTLERHGHYVFVPLVE